MPVLVALAMDVIREANLRDYICHFMSTGEIVLPLSLSLSLIVFTLQKLAHT